MPGTANTVSMTTLPPSKPLACSPTMVATGSTALRAMCRQTMRRRRKPLASAVRI